MKNEKDDNSLPQKESSQWIFEYTGISFNTMTCWIPSLCPQCLLWCLACRRCFINYSWSDLNCIEWWNEFRMLPSDSIPHLLLPLFIPYTCVKTGKFSEFLAADLNNEEEGRGREGRGRMKVERWKMEGRKKGKREWGRKRREETGNWSFEQGPWGRTGGRRE